MTTRACTAVLAVTLLVSHAVEAAGHWEFEVENRSNASIVGFRTHENGRWSVNWIDVRIRPGDSFDMDFGTTQGDCVVRTQIRFSDGGYFDRLVDYCKITRLLVYPRELRWQ